MDTYMDYFIGIRGCSPYEEQGIEHMRSQQVKTKKTNKTQAGEFENLQ